MLRRIDIKGFKSLVSVELELSPLTVVFGPNAVGKSNFLESLVLLARVATERTLADAFDEPLRGYPAEAFTLPDNGLPGLLQAERTELRVEADLVGLPGLRAGEALRYRVAVQMRPTSGSLEVTDEYLVRLRRDGTPKQKPRIERVDSHLLIRRLGEAGQPRQEIVGLNHALVSNLQFSGRERYPDFDRVRGELGSWKLYYLDPRDSMRSPQPPRDTTDIGARGELLAPFLYRLQVEPKHTRNRDAVARALHSVIPTIDALRVDLDPQRGTLDIVVQQEGTPYSSRVISEGTLRVLALCAIAASPWSSSLVAFEEPENGVHPRRIEAIADLLTSLVRRDGRQVVVTTHSPVLVGAFLRLQREYPALVGLYLCSQEGRASTVSRFADPGSLFSDNDIREALVGHEDELLVQSALLRGWLDG